MEKTEKPKISPESTLKKAEKLMAKNLEFWLYRNAKNQTTGKVTKRKLEKGWRILNIGHNRLITMSKDNEIFNISAEELENLNKHLFDLFIFWSV